MATFQSPRLGSPLSTNSRHLACSCLTQEPWLLWLLPISAFPTCQDYNQRRGQHSTPPLVYPAAYIERGIIIAPKGFPGIWRAHCFLDLLLTTLASDSDKHTYLVRWRVGTRWRRTHRTPTLAVCDHRTGVTSNASPALKGKCGTTHGLAEDDAQHVATITGGDPWSTHSTAHRHSSAHRSCVEYLSIKRMLVNKKTHSC